MYQGFVGVFGCAKDCSHTYWTSDSGLGRNHQHGSWIRYHCDCWCFISLHHMAFCSGVGSNVLFQLLAQYDYSRQVFWKYISIVSYTAPRHSFTQNIQYFVNICSRPFQAFWTARFQQERPTITVTRFFFRDTRRCNLSTAGKYPNHVSYAPQEKSDLLCYIPHPTASKFIRPLSIYSDITTNFWCSMANIITNQPPPPPVN